jgi:hypothetical protein
VGAKKGGLSDRANMFSLQPSHWTRQVIGNVVVNLIIIETVPLHRIEDDPVVLTISGAQDLHNSRMSGFRTAARHIPGIRLSSLDCIDQGR